MKTKRLVRLSLLTAISLVIFVVETRIPSLVPIPGVKLGLANIITVVAVYLCSPWEAALMLTVRIILGSIFCGTPLSFLYSIAGGALCLSASIASKSVIPETRMWLTSIIGAIFHNLGQILAAALILRTASVFVYLPVLMITGSIAGLFCGLCAQLIVKRIHTL